MPYGDKCSPSSPAVFHREMSMKTWKLQSSPCDFPPCRRNRQHLTSPTPFSLTGSGPHVSAGLAIILVVIHNRAGAGNRLQSCGVIKGLSLASLNSLAPCWRGAYAELMAFGGRGKRREERGRRWESWKKKKKEKDSVFLCVVYTDLWELIPSILPVLFFLIHKYTVL